VTLGGHFYFVCPSVTLSSQAFYLAITRVPTDAIEMKLHMRIELKQVKSHAQDP